MTRGLRAAAAEGPGRLAWLDRPLWLFVLPILVGVAFWADSSGHGDAAAYRTMVLQTWETGRLPLGQWEFLHPGHYLVAALVFGAGRLAGLWTDPIHACSLLNFVALGWLAWTCWQVLRALLPDAPRSFAWLPSLFVATIPGWAWSAQTPMTDVCGHALALIVAGRILLHECRLQGSAAARPEPRWSFALTGFLASFAFLVRISAVAFIPLYLFLGLRVWIATPRPGRLPRLAWLLGGAFAPLALFYGHLLWAYGWEAVRVDYLRMSTDNQGPKSDLMTMLPGWWELQVQGLGPTIWLGVAGILVWIPCMFSAGLPHPLRSRRILFPALMLLLLPYQYLVYRNRAWFEFRYQLPALFAYGMATSSIVLLLVRLRLAGLAMLLVFLVPLLHMVHAWPWLEISATRTDVNEARARLLTAVAPEDALLLAESSVPYCRLLVSGRKVFGVRAGPEESGYDVWSQSWSEMRDLLGLAAGEGIPVWCSDEPGLERFLHRLEQLGWQRRLRSSQTGKTTRRQHQDGSGGLDLERAIDCPPILVYELVPPPVPCAPIHHEVRFSTDDGLPEFVLNAELIGWEGQDYRVLFGSERAVPAPMWNWRLWLPFHDGDTAMAASLSDEFLVELGLGSLRGRIGPEARVQLRFAGPLAIELARHGSTVLVLPAGGDPRAATLRTPFRPGPGRKP